MHVMGRLCDHDASLLKITAPPTTPEARHEPALRTTPTTTPILFAELDLRRKCVHRHPELRWELLEVRVMTAGEDTGKAPGIIHVGRTRRSFYLGELANFSARLFILNPVSSPLLPGSAPAQLKPSITSSTQYVFPSADMCSSDSLLSTVWCPVACASGLQQISSHEARTRRPNRVSRSPRHAASLTLVRMRSQIHNHSA